MSNENYEEEDGYSSVDEIYDEVNEFDLADDQDRDQDNKAGINATMTSSELEPFSLTLTRSEDHEGRHFSIYILIYCKIISTIVL
jgi:hypothetical protein